MLYGHTNGNVNRKNMVKKIEYPEHKLKNKEAIVLQDFDKNYHLLDNTKSFYDEVKQWEEDQQFLNFNRKHHKNRTLSKEDFNNKLDNKAIATTYTISENSLFFARKFNNDINEINKYYSNVLDAFLEEANIPKDKVINAIIHHDQTTPHLHIAISNIVDKFSKEHQKHIKSVNMNSYNLYSNLINNKKLEKEDYEKWIKLKQIKNDYQNQKISLEDLEAFRNDNYDVGVLSKVINKVNNKYILESEKSLYNDQNDYVYMHNIRGFSNEEIVNLVNRRAKNEHFLKLQNNIILSSRKTQIENEIFHWRYKKQLLDSNREQQLQNRIKNDESDNKNFEEYIKTKYNKMYSSFILDMNKNLSNKNKKQLINLFQLQNQNEKLAFEQAINKFSKLEILANKTTKIEEILSNVSSKYDEKLATELNIFQIWMNELGINTKNNLINFDESTNTLKWTKGNWDEKLIKTMKQAQLIRTIFQDVKKELFALDKNWVYKQELILLEKKYQFDIDKTINSISISNSLELNLSNYEKNLMFKKILREKIDFDLKSLNLYNKFKQQKLNSIERAREYNKILEFCFWKQQVKEQLFSITKNELRMKADDLATNFDAYTKKEQQSKIAEINELGKIYLEGNKYTPQNIVKEIWLSKFEPINFTELKESINIQKISDEQKELHINRLIQLKQIEYSILNLNFDKKQLEENYSFSLEKEIFQIAMKKFNEELKINSKELAYEAKKINNWFTEKEFENDINQIQKNSQPTWKDELIDNDLKLIQEKSTELNLNLNNEIQNSLVDIDFIREINNENILDLAKNENQNEELSNNTIAIQNNKLEKNREKDINDYQCIFESNSLSEAKTKRNINKMNRERLLQQIISMAKDGLFIDDLCQKANISKSFIIYKINKNKKQNKDNTKEIFNDITRTR